MTGATGGKRAGSRRGPRRRRGFQPILLLLAIGITACVVAWGYLVYAAIDFGSAARGGDDNAWWFLALASAGAVACLFVGLMLSARVLRRLGITNAPATRRDQPRPTAGADMPGADMPGADMPGAGGPARTEPRASEPTDRPRPIGGRRAAR